MNGVEVTECTSGERGRRDDGGEVELESSIDMQSTPTKVNYSSFIYKDVRNS